MRSLPAILRDFADVEVCGRCLVPADSRMPIRAKNDREGKCEFFHNAMTDPVALKAWVVEKILDGYWFEIGDTSERFVPISTWHGDPVCRWHLYYLANNEKGIPYC